MRDPFRLIQQHVQLPKGDIEEALCGIEKAYEVIRNQDTIV